MESEKKMKLVIQRVSHASVTVNGERIAAINKGFLVLVGIGKEDSQAEVERIVKKMIGLRIFEDENGKTNLALKDVRGELLIVSQFTLYADCRKGNRPSFIQAAPPEQAMALYESIIEECKKEIPVVQSGEFGADMKIELLNDGPFTIILE